ncbi:RsmB/NOP family class I SAM-dependent RNA methyltransferase [Puniceibacterium sp. IMCC21224]|uniref:RsmB/NOP family class I SAM-dependent RNA methyltransferase n=1 Tax=Puniceibacterium sp. IMCC21224 TaxID=1618204 RepID=UPI00064DF885|nr:RsmB/NOP family class I SAM-dependent RNA methyltransferase [Puniceibacterium sp. IMCC21224]KMK67264.1 tRNA/rRNA cytosine-C5-methylase [Puniceibacterium sp. IMCC21224]
MTPAARINAAIGLIDYIQSGELADRALANWGRNNRYAGSKDRAAIGDILFDVLRNMQSFSEIGGGQTGRALLLGYVRASGQDPETIFGVDGYAPPKLSDDERISGIIEGFVASESADFPDWIWPELVRSYGDKAAAITQALRIRAPIYLRVNLSKLNRGDAIDSLATEGIIGQISPLSPSAVQVLEGARKIRNSTSFLNGEVELQDASSQAVADLVPLQTGQKLLDFCAGAGGKVLAVAGRVSGVFYAHDVDARRMKDLQPRASRAGTSVKQVSIESLVHGSQFDTVLVDAPCSGSGSWRRDPQGKWLLNQEKLDQVIQRQQEIFDQVSALVRPQGHLVYATCSLFQRENEFQVEKFLDHNKDFSLLSDHHFTPLEGGDGFYCAVLCRN